MFTSPHSQPARALCVALALLCALWASQGLAQAPLEAPPEGAPPVLIPQDNGARLGLLVPLTGKQKRLGQAVLDVVNFARVELGGAELVVVDTRGSAQGAREGVERLAADPSVVAVLGPVGWHSSQAAALRAQELGLPLLTLSAQEGIERVGRFIFRGRPSIEEQARRMARVAVLDLQLERLAILYPEDTLGQAAAEAFFEEARRQGARVMAMSSYKPGETNLTEAVERLVGRRMHKLHGGELRRPPRGQLRRVDKEPRLEFDGVFVPDYDEGAALAAKFMRFHDVSLAGVGELTPVQVLGTGLLPGPRLVDAEGLLAGALYPEFFHPERVGERSRAFAERFLESFARQPADLEAQVYDLYAALLEQAQGCQEGQVARCRASLPGSLVEMEPRLGLAGLHWFLPDGAPGHPLDVWVVEGDGRVSPSE